MGRGPKRKWIVRWHPEAVAERDLVRPEKELPALHRAVEKLEALGIRLPMPHARDVKGADGKGFRELRPRAGSSRWRAIYRRVTEDTFVIFAVVPEVETNRRGYNAGVRKARERFEQLPLD